MNFEIEKANQYNLPEKAKLSTCPKCSEHRKPSNQKQKCLMLNWERGLGTCQHCGEVLQLHTYKRKDAPNKDYKRPLPPVSYDLSDKVKEFFKSRNISDRALRVARVTEGIEWMPQFKKEVQTIHFNYFLNNELINVKYRGANKSFKLAKDAELIMSGIDRWINEKEVIICEGEIDELSYIEAGFINVSSVPNGANSKTNNLAYLDNSYEFIEGKEKIYLSLDNDEAGRSLQKELIRRLGADRCYIVNLGEYKDANEALMKEGISYLQSAILNAKACPLENVLTYNDVKADLHNFLLNGSAKGYTIGLNSFDSIFSTYTSQYIVVTGIPSHGKSDWVDQMCIGYNLSYGFKVAYCSPENKPSFLHTEKLVRKIYGRKAESIEEIKHKNFQVIEEHIQDNFFFMEYEAGYDLETTLAKAEELVKRKGIRVFVLDPFNKIPLKGASRSDVNQYTTDYLNMIDVFCKKHDVLIILVAHPVKMKAHVQGGTPPEPSFYDIKGGGEFYDMSYHGLCVYRDFENETVKIKVLKCKFSNLGENGASTHFMWNINNGRYSEIEGTIEAGFTPIWDNSAYIQPSGISYEEKKGLIKNVEHKTEDYGRIKIENPLGEFEKYQDFDQACGF